MSSVYCGIEKIGHVVTSLIPLDPPLALKPAHNQSWGKKLASKLEEGVEQDTKERQATEEKRTEQEEVVGVMRIEK